MKERSGVMMIKNIIAAAMAVGSLLGGISSMIKVCRKDVQDT
jgi:hypothetical protein